MLSQVTYSFKSYSRKDLGGKGEVLFHIYLSSLLIIIIINQINM